VIRDTELRSVAGKYKVKLSKVERDYAQNWCFFAKYAIFAQNCLKNAK
jgi:hypothetical protein